MICCQGRQPVRLIFKHPFSHFEIDVLPIFSTFSAFISLDDLLLGRGACTVECPTRPCPLPPSWPSSRGSRWSSGTVPLYRDHQKYSLTWRQRGGGSGGGGSSVYFLINDTGSMFLPDHYQTLILTPVTKKMTSLERLRLN